MNVPATRLAIAALPQGATFPPNIFVKLTSRQAAARAHNVGEGPPATAAAVANSNVAAPAPEGNGSQGQEGESAPPPPPPYPTPTTSTPSVRCESPTPKPVSPLTSLHNYIKYWSEAAAGIGAAAQIDKPRGCGHWL